MCRNFGAGEYVRADQASVPALTQAVNHILRTAKYREKAAVLQTLIRSGHSAERFRNLLTRFIGLEVKFEGYAPCHPDDRTSTHAYEAQAHHDATEMCVTRPICSAEPDGAQGSRMIMADSLSSIEGTDRPILASCRIGCSMARSPVVRWPQRGCLSSRLLYPASWSGRVFTHRHRGAVHRPVGPSLTQTEKNKDS